MPVCFTTTKQDALAQLGEHTYYHILTDSLETYGQTKWAIIREINAHFKQDFCLSNWLTFNQEDEIAYFLNEAGSNTFNHAQYNHPHAFHVWIGEHGALIGVEQEGEGFAASRIAQRKAHSGGFSFYHQATHTVFFDNPEHATITYLLWKK